MKRVIPGWYRKVGQTFIGPFARHGDAAGHNPFAKGVYYLTEGCYPEEWAKCEFKLPLRHRVFPVFDEWWVNQCTEGMEAEDIARAAWNAAK